MKNHFRHFQKIDRDWFGRPLSPPVNYCLKKQSEDLVFEASRQAASLIHPEAQAGKFTPELWRYDVAELFILDPKKNRYLELNLAPNGAWWACWFSAPRIPETVQPEFHAIQATGQVEEHNWEATLSIPLNLLPPLETALHNVTFILDSPEQRFLTAYPLGSGEPDFHRPEHFHAFADPS